MSSAKEDILARIRSSLADAPVAPEPVRNYRRVSELNEEQTIEMLVDRLIDYKANVVHANKENISEIIAERLGEKSTYVVPEGLNMSGCRLTPLTASASPTPVAPSSPVA